MLPDVLQPDLGLVFCGTAAGETSARCGAYYAGRGNRFWAVLHETGLTPRRLVPSEFLLLPEFGIGLTDACKTESGMDADLSSRAFDIDGLVGRLERVRPAVIAFNGLRSAQVVLGRRRVAYGVQPESIAGAHVHALPSTSGAAQGHWDITYWQALSNAVNAARAQGV